MSVRISDKSAAWLLKTMETVEEKTGPLIGYTPEAASVLRELRGAMTTPPRPRKKKVSK